MKKIKQILENISTLDFLTILVAIFSSCVFLAAFATMLSPEKMDKVYKVLFICSVLSYALSYLVLKPAKPFFFSKLPVDVMWLFVIALGSIGNTYFIINILNFTKSSEQSEFPLEYSSVFLTFFLLAVIPAAFFRFTMNSAISFWQERNEKLISIVN
jgi:hypothetical protein